MGLSHIYPPSTPEKLCDSTASEGMTGLGKDFLGMLRFRCSPFQKAL